jgi:thymidine phosphorylase
VASASELAVALRQVAVDSGVRCEALITDMNQPLGPALGTACEVREALAVLSGAGDVRLREVTMQLCIGVMTLRGWDPEEATAVLDRALADGSAMAAWLKIAAAHGADPDPELLARPRSAIEVLASAEGFVTSCDGEDLGRVAAEVGAGRRRVNEALAHGAGVLVHARIGDRIESDQPVATLLVGEREVDEQRLTERIRQAFTIGPERVDPPELILGTAEDIAE